jgi:hypothetical protein
MADDIVRRIIIEGRSRGVAEVVAELQRLTGGYEGAAVAADKQGRASLSVENALERERRALDENYRAQRQLEGTRGNLARARQQGLIDQAEEGRLLGLAVTRHNQYGAAVTASTGVQKAFAAATSGLSGQLIALSAGAGPVGTFLSSFGPWGLLAAGGIGLVTSAISHMREEADRIGDKAIEIKKFGEVSGLSAEQIMGLNKAGAQLGVGTEQITTSVGRFTVGLEAAHQGAGDLFEQIQAIDPALAKQLSQTRTTAAGWDLYSQALKRANDAGDISQRNLLGRAGFGRGGLETVPVAVATANQGGLDAIATKTKEITGLTNEWSEKVAHLRQENEIIEKQIANMKANAYAAEVLERQNQFLKIEKEITEEFLKRGGSQNKYGDPNAVGVLGGVGAGTVPTSAVKPNNSLALSAGLNDIGPDPQAIAGWKALDEAIAGASRSMKEMQDANARAINAEKARIGALGEFADSLDKVKLKQLELKQALDTGKIGLDDWERVNRAIQQQIDYISQLKAAYGGVSGDIAVQAQALQNQINVAAQIIPVKAQQVQYEQTITTLMGQGQTRAEATLIAEQQRALQVAKANADADRKLKGLKEEYDVLQATTEGEKDRVKSRQEYNRLLEQGVSEERAAAVKGQMDRNSEARDTSQSWSVTHDQAVLAANAANALAVNTEEAAIAAHNYRMELEKAARGPANVLFGTYMPVGMDPFGVYAYTAGKDAWNDFTTQFNPAGYSSTIGPNPNAMATSLGGPARDPKTGLPSQQGLTDMVNSILGKSGSVTDAIDKLLNGTGGFGSKGLDSASLQLLQQLTDFLPDNQKPDVINREIASLRAQSPSVETLSTIKQLTDSLDQLKQSTDANTSATHAQTEVLSPLYSQDSRQTHQGYRAFAEGGVTTRPTLSLTSENYQAEAIIPLRDLPRLLAANGNAAPASAGGAGVTQITNNIDNSMTVYGAGGGQGVDRLRKSRTKQLQELTTLVSRRAA